MKTLCFVSDFDGCHYFRVNLPFKELRRFGVESTEYCFLPSSLEMNQTNLLLNMISQYDLVIVQRCYLFSIVKSVKTICEFLGKPLIFETDDDYFHLMPNNPAFYAIVDDQELFKKFYQFQQDGNTEETQKLVPALLESRKRGLEGYKEILRMVDWVTVSTEELARTVYPYNKNVIVLQNNVERVYPWRDIMDIKSCLRPIEGNQEQFTIEIPNTLGLWTIPNFESIDEKTVRKIPRIGYTGTQSHAGEDFETVREALNEYHEEHAPRNDHALVMLGDPHFSNCIPNRVMTYGIPPSFPYDKYMFNVRNIDVMLCPLHPNVFNMSKSDIKILEAGCWGSTALAPRYVTYTRNFKEDEHCLFYSNAEEFKDQLDRLVKDYTLRERLGKNLYEYVRDNRLERLHSEKRYEFYKKVIADKKPLDRFEPNKEKVC